jgi:CTP:phosphocholine cytidylyltransferase-like protein
MNKPQPTQEAIVRQMADRTIRITVHTPDALSIVETARQFGRVYEAIMHANMYDLFVVDGYDVTEVLQYLKSQV